MNFRTAFRWAAQILLLYFICSLYAYLFSRLIHLGIEYNNNYWLLLSPCLIMGIAFLIRTIQYKGFVNVLLLTIIILSIKSDIIGLYAKYCNYDSKHTELTFALTHILLISACWMLIGAFKTKKVNAVEIILAIIASVFFEIAVSIPSISLLEYLHSI